MTLVASSYTQLYTSAGFQQLHSICQTPLNGRTLCAFAYTFGTDYHKAIVVDINGTETGVLVGTATNIERGDSGLQFSDADISALTSDGTDGAVYYMNDRTSHDIQANTFSVDGSRNITMNTLLEIPTDSGLEDHTSIDRIDDTHLFVVHNKWVSGGGRVNCYILTESAGTLTASSALTLTSDSDNDSKVGAVVLSSSRAFVFFEDDINGAQVALINISGANPTLTDGPDQIEASSQHDYNFFHKIADKLDSTHAVCTYSNGTANKLRVIQNNSDVIVIGSAVTDNNSGHRCTVAVADSTRFAIAHRTNGQIRTYLVSGNTITAAGGFYTLPNNPTPLAPNRSVIAFAQMDGDDYLWISVHGDSNDTLWAAQIREETGASIALDTLTLVSSAETNSVFRTQLMSTLSLISSAEFVTLNIIALNTLTLTGSPEALFIIPIGLNTLTLIGSPETIFVKRIVVVNTLTLAGSPEALIVVAGAISVTVNTLTLAGSAESLGVGSPGVVALDTLSLVSSPENLGRVQTFIFNPTQISNLREAAHKVKARLTIFAPPVLWTGQVDGTHDRGETDIVYDSGSGSLTFVRDFLQIIVGTSPGADDVGRLRVDDTASMLLATGTITVDENAIVWVPGLHLSIEHLFPIERINPRIAGGVLYKYFDVAYTNQNGQDETEPVCVAGADQVAELVSGSHVFDIDLSESYPTTAGVISSYTLSVAPTLGAVVSFNTGTGIGTVTVSQAGYWWAICSTTDSFGNTMERFVLLRAHDSTDTDFIEVTITGYTEVWGGGVRMSVEARENLTLSNIPDNAIAYLWHENKFDGSVGYVNILTIHDTILFNGYVRSDRGRSDFNTGDKSASFELTTVDGLMENLPLRSITVRLKSSPAAWWQYQLLTTGEAIWFLFRWHSTVPWRHDMIGIMTFDKFQRRIAADFEEGSLFRMANQVGFDRGVIAKITCDRLGRIHFVQDTQLLNQTDRDSVISAFDIQEEDVSGVIDIVRNPEPRVHQMQISGFLYSTSGDGTPFISIIPGYRPSDTSFSMPERRGSSFKNIPNQLLQSQTESNERVGRFFAQANLTIKEFRIPFRGNYLTALTTIPSFGWYELNIQDTNLARELEVNSLRMLCRSISASIDSQTGIFQVTGVFEPEAQGPDGILGNYPTGLIADTIEVLPQPEEVEFAAEALLVGQSAEYRRTYPEELVDADWTQLDASSFNHVAIDPWWKIVNETEDPDNLIWIGVGSGTITLFNQALDAADVETDITPTNDPPNTWSDGVAPTVAALEFVEVLGDRFIQDRFYVLAEWQEVGGDWRTWVAITSDAGTSWTWLDFFNGYTLADQAKARNLAVNNTYLMTVLVEAETGLASDTEYLRVYTKSDLIGFSRTRTNTSASVLGWDTVSSASVITVTDDDDIWLVFGNMFGGPANPLNIEHVVFTLDAGATWQLYEDRWTGGAIDNKCIALRVGPIDTAGFRKIWAIRS